jgi:biopolymer transport protein ExbD
MTPRWRPRPIVVGEPAPMINTTPLIDLMLVLLVMLMLSIPVSTHKMPIDVPTGPTPPGPPPAHRLDIDAAGRPSWDGRRVDDAQLRARLAGMAADPAQPVLHFAADAETRYQRVDETLALVLRAGVTRLGFVGNQEFHRTLDRRPD